MESFKESLVSKLDLLLAQLTENNEFPDGTYVQIEACIFHDRRKAGLKKPPRRVLLDTVSLDDYQPSQPSPISQGEHPPQDHFAQLKLPKPVGFNVESRRGADVVEVRTNGNVTGGDLCAPSRSHRREVGGLHLGNPRADGVVEPPAQHRRASSSCAITTPPRTPTPPTTARQLETHERQFPKRRKRDRDGPAKLQQSTVDKLIEGIWEQIHRPRSLALGRELGEMFSIVNKRLTDGIAGTPMRIDFEDASRCCQQITSGSRTNRALEVIVQAYWVDCYDARIVALCEDRADLKIHEVKRAVLAEACRVFQWSQKELRNRLAIWKGYKEIKDSAGWSALIFAGPGIYRFCKYRMGFDQDALAKLQALRSRIEVAADTLQPKWRELLSLVGASTQIHWRGHPHDWVVSKRKDPVPLAFTYRQLHPGFRFKHLEESILDHEKWGTVDPRRLDDGPHFVCPMCTRKQSMLAEQNECECFPNLFGPTPRTPPPVQVFRTDNGKLNGLIACCAFERGHAVGEFVGLVTKGISGADVMQGQAGQNEPYQIWQGHSGNFTRFLNHSCQPNCQFQTFSWLGIQRILVVAKGVPGGKELTVDYSGRYWQGLDKECLCGEPRCRYKGRPH